MNIRDLQDSAKPKRQVIRYTDLEWHYLACAVHAEWFQTSVNNLTKSLVQIVNQAQDNQTGLLPQPWPKRKFTAVIQLMPAIKELYVLLDTSHLSGRIKKLEAANMAQLTEINNLKKLQIPRTPSLQDFKPEEIIAEAALLQAAQAEAAFKANSELKQDLSKVCNSLQAIAIRLHETEKAMYERLTKIESSVDSIKKEEGKGIGNQVREKIMTIIPIEGTDEVEVRVGCGMCGGEEVFKINKRKVELLDRSVRRAKNVYIQTAFPELSDGQREAIMSGTCETCYDELFEEDV